MSEHDLVTREFTLTVLADAGVGVEVVDAGGGVVDLFRDNLPPLSVTLPPNVGRKLIPETQPSV